MIFTEHAEVDERGYWCPQAQVRFSSGLRTSGLLQTIPDEELKSLLCVLSFVTADGQCAPALSLLAEAMRVSPGKARSRLERLVAWRWQGQSVLSHWRAESGLELYSPLPIIAARHEAAPTDRNGAALLIKGGSRNAVIAHTRATYARPRAEVEADILKQFRHTPPEHSQEIAEPVAEEDPERATVRRQLLEVGLTHEQSKALLSRYDLVRIRRQLAWLPYHSVRNRAGFLLAAIKDDYAAPHALLRAAEASKRADNDG